jgi:STE24 endopeptidase
MLAGLAALGVLALLLVPWQWVPGEQIRPVGAEDVFSTAEIARAEGFSGFVRRLGHAATAVSLLVSFVLGLSPAGSRLYRLVARLLPSPGTRVLRLPLVVLLCLLAGQAATLPFALAGRRRRLAEGLTHQDLAGWLADRGLSLLVSWLTATLLVGLVVGCARRWPRRWFLPAGLAAAAAVFAGSLLYPVLVEPMFNRFTPLADGSLRASLLDLAEREGVEVDEVLVADASRRTTTLNAYVSGLAGTRRVVVYDTLVADAPEAEVRAVVAHELAHARRHDVLLGTSLGALGAFVGMGVLALVLDRPGITRRAGVRGPGDPAAAALVLSLVVVGSFLVSPLENVVSRAIEARADVGALEATGEYDAFRALQRTLALRSLADPEPPALSRIWFASHPTVLQRVALADAVERRDG